MLLGGDLTVGAVRALIRDDQAALGDQLGVVQRDQVLLLQAQRTIHDLAKQPPHQVRAQAVRAGQFAYVCELFLFAFGVAQRQAALGLELHQRFDRALTLGHGGDDLGVEVVDPAAQRAELVLCHGAPVVFRG